MTDKTVEETNNLIGEQVIDLIQKLHSRMRPFILIFPPLEGDSPPQPQTVTNISDPGYVHYVLHEHLESTKDLTEFEILTKARGRMQ